MSTKVSIGPPQQSWQSSFQSNRIEPPSDRFQLASSRSEQPTSAVQPANTQLSLGVNRSQPANSWVRPAAQIDPRTPRRPETRRTSMGTFGDLVSSAEVNKTKVESFYDFPEFQNLYFLFNSCIVNFPPKVLLWKRFS